MQSNVRLLHHGMWAETTDEEADFIFDYLSHPDDSQRVMSYAHWLEARDPIRAECFRLSASPEKNESRLAVLREQVDPRWLALITSTKFRVGDDVLITNGSFAGMKGSVVEVDATGGRAGLFLHIFYRPFGPTWVPFADLQLIRRGRIKRSEYFGRNEQ